LRFLSRYTISKFERRGLLLSGELNTHASLSGELSKKKSKLLSVNINKDAFFLIDANGFDLKLKPLKFSN
jgi:hypothetical protein